MTERTVVAPADNRDYVIGNTHVLNNALGYPSPDGVDTAGFRSDLVIELN